MSRVADPARKARRRSVAKGSQAGRMLRMQLLGLSAKPTWTAPGN